VQENEASEGAGLLTEEVTAVLENSPAEVLKWREILIRHGFAG